MSAVDAKAVRDKLGVGLGDLADELGLAPDVVEAWETGKIRPPAWIARELRWREAVFERERELARHSPECEWITAWRSEIVPDTPRAREAHRASAVRHRKSCHYCQTREAYASVWFGEPPSRPAAWWTKTLARVTAPIHRWPSWTLPAAWMGASFGTFSLLRAVIMLRSLRVSPRLIVTTVEGFLVYVSIGAAIGLGVGGVRALASRRRARAT
ncbi:MAG TPA: hypothetical protein VFT29_04970 [Gemmatimonadaceae bacterium]|nr:hypothetical protein [Gemmatimonadaceae bacterium]